MWEPGVTANVLREAELLDSEQKWTTVLATTGFVTLKVLPRPSSSVAITEKLLKLAGWSQPHLLGESSPICPICASGFGISLINIGLMV